MAKDMTAGGKPRRVEMDLCIVLAGSTIIVSTPHHWHLIFIEALFMLPAMLALV